MKCLPTGLFLYFRAVCKAKRKSVGIKMRRIRHGEAYRCGITVLIVFKLDDGYARVVHIEGRPEKYRRNAQKMRKPGRAEALMAEHRNAIVVGACDAVFQALAHVSEICHKGIRFAHDTLIALFCL